MGSQQTSCFSEDDLAFMSLALEQAKRSELLGEVPVGAVLVVADQAVSFAHNQPIGLSDPSAHAEMLCVRHFCSKIQNYRLPPDSKLYVTLEPCAMCLGMLIHARLGRLVYAAKEPRAGAIVSAQQYDELTHFNHRIDVAGGLLAEQSADLLKSFFKNRRTKTNSAAKVLGLD